MWAGGGRGSQTFELGPEGFMGTVCQVEIRSGRHPRSGSSTCKYSPPARSLNTSLKAQGLAPHLRPLHTWPRTHNLGLGSLPVPILTAHHVLPGLGLAPQFTAPAYPAPMLPLYDQSLWTQLPHHRTSTAPQAALIRPAPSSA